MTKKQRAIVVFPGRGSYSAQELGYLRLNYPKRLDFIHSLDQVRKKQGASSVLKLDKLPKFSVSEHLTSRNASNLIYTCAQADFLEIDRTKFEIVGICGNSLGWYLTLAASGALSFQDGARLVDSMGHLMQKQGVGQQLLCSVTTDDWQIDSEQRWMVMNLIDKTPNLFLSIDLGGSLVLAGSNEVIHSIKKDPVLARYVEPSVLPKHSAFHTPLLKDVSNLAQSSISKSFFDVPLAPIIDGRGLVWSQLSTDIDALYNYTLNQQIIDLYNFKSSIEIALKEFAPDRIILTGPGSSLGASIAQCLVANTWQGIRDRDSFLKRQATDPLLLAMGRSEQRKLVV